MPSALPLYMLAFPQVTNRSQTHTPGGDVQHEANKLYGSLLHSLEHIPSSACFLTYPDEDQRPWIFTRRRGNGVRA